MMYFVLSMIDYLVSHSLAEFSLYLLQKAVKKIYASIGTSKLHKIKKNINH